MAIQPNPTPRPDYSRAGAARDRMPPEFVGMTTTEAQALIDASIADVPTNAEAETIAEGVVAAALPDGTSAGDILYWNGTGWAVLASGTGVLTNDGAGTLTWETP